MEHEERSDYAPQFEGNAFVALLRDRRTFADFVAAFVDVGTLKPRLQFDTAARLERKFITEALREGERDVVWKIPIAGGELFVIVLVEHQSAIDYAMPMRLLFYMNALWQDHYHAADVEIRRSREFRAPPILPIVLYTGENAWSGATRLTDVIACGEELGGLLPDFRFQIIDLARFRDTDFATPGNFACAIMHVVWALMRGAAGEEFTRIFEELRPFWHTPELELLGPILYHYACAEGRPDMAERVYDVLRRQEDGMSNPEVVRKRFWEVWAEEGRAEGLAEGKAEGKAVGEAEGEARRELQNLREQVEAISAFFARRGLPWEAYAADIEGFRRHRDAADFLVDLATAPDMAGFLKARFGH